MERSRKESEKLDGLEREARDKGSGTASVVCIRLYSLVGVKSSLTFNLFDFVLVLGLLGNVSEMVNLLSDVGCETVGTETEW